MSDSLMNELLTFAQDKRELIGLCKNNEQQTKNSLVEPYIRLLGFDPSNAHEVRVEYHTATVRAADRVDYALMAEDRPIVFVEAKSLSSRDVSNTSLMNKQLRSYMLDSVSVKFGSLTDGRLWMWYYKENHHVEPVLFLKVDALAESQNKSTVEWISQLRKRAKKQVPVNEMLVAARLISLASRVKKWFIDSRDNPTDTFTRVLLKEIGETSMAKARLDQCKLSWKQAMRDLFDNPTTDKVVEPVVRPKPPTKGEPVDSLAGKTCALQYSDGSKEAFSTATHLLLGIVNYCSKQHDNGKHDYYNRIKKPLPGTSKLSAWITDKEFESLTNPTKYYSSMSHDGHHVFRNLSNKQKVLLIKALLNECTTKSGTNPRIGSELQIHLPNSSLQILT